MCPASSPWSWPEGRAPKLEWQMVRLLDSIGRLEERTWKILDPKAAVFAWSATSTDGWRMRPNRCGLQRFDPAALKPPTHAAHASAFKRGTESHGWLLTCWHRIHRLGQFFEAFSRDPELTAGLWVLHRLHGNNPAVVALSLIWTLTLSCGHS